MKIWISVLILVCTTICAQTTNQTHEFKFYKKGKLRSSKNVEFYIVETSDTIKCAIQKETITIPSLTTVHDVILRDGKRQYVLKNVDFSKVDPKATIFFGIEKNVQNFQSVKNVPSSYVIPNIGTVIQIDDFNSAKEVRFLSFSSVLERTNIKFSMKTYSRTSIIKK